MTEPRPPLRVDPRPVLVLGGTGHYGRMIVAALLAHGQSVRVLSRSAVAARATLGDGPEVIEGDVTSRESVVRALDGVGRIVIALSAFSPALIRQQRRIERDAVLMVIEEAERIGGMHVVYLCGYEMRAPFIERFDFDAGRITIEVQARLAASSLSWTVLGESPSFGIFFETLRGDRMVFPGGGPPAFPTVSGADVGEISAQAALRDDLAGRRFRVTGPEALSFPEAARRMAAITGRPITFMAVPLLGLRAAAFVSRPFYPYLRHIAAAARMLNEFPQDLVAQVPADHRLLRDTFDYQPVTFEEEVSRRLLSQPKQPS